MRCAVFNCNANNSKGNPNLRFYVFPKDNILRKQWICFCRRKDNLNPNTSRICSAHFTPDDFERNLQFEMGLCKNNGFKLKMGTVPRKQPQSTVSPSSRDIRMQSKENKQMIASLLEEKPVPIAGPEAIKDEVIEPTNINDLIPEIENVKELKETIMMLKQEIEDLKKDKFMLMEHEMAYEKLTLSLHKKLEKSEQERLTMEKQLKEIFTTGQVNKLKNGLKRLKWSEADIAQSIALYSTSAKAYKLLRKKNFPLPGVRTLQKWAHKLDKTIH